MKLKGKLILAPMAGVTNLPFRLLCKKYGADLVFTEMVNANAVSRGNKASLRLAETCKAEKPVGVQLFGARLDAIKKSAEMLKDRCDIIDFNFGCPASKVIKIGAGAGLLQRPKRVGEIVKVLVETGKPVSAKIRILKDKKKLLEVVKAIEENGASWITVHGRTLGQGYSGKANYEWIKFVKDNVSIPVVGNGDVRDKESYLKILKETGCDYVMIGRAAMGNPGIFSEVQGKKVPNKFKMFKEFVKICDKYKYDSVKMLKEQAIYFTKGLVGGSSLRNRLSRCKTKEEIIEIMDL